MPKKRITVRVALDERPSAGSTYRAAYADKAAAMSRHGMIDREIAEVLGVSLRTFRVWMVQYPKFKAAMVMAKEEADNRVELSLYHQAIGYDYIEEEIKIIDGEIIKVKVQKHQPANVVASCAWLNNRKRNDWSRNPEPPALPGPTSDLPEADARTLAGRDLHRRVAFMLFQADKGKVN